MQEIQANCGIKPCSQAILEGTYETSYEISEGQAAWFRVVKPTGREQKSMNKEQIQPTFKLAQE